MRRGARSWSWNGIAISIAIPRTTTRTTGRAKTLRTCIHDVQPLPQRGRAAKGTGYLREGYFAYFNALRLSTFSGSLTGLSRPSASRADTPS